MKKKNSFLFRDEFWEVFEELDMKQRGLLLSAMHEFHANGDSDYLKDQPMRMAFVMIRNSMRRDRDAYDAECARNAENVRKRWENTDEKDRTRSYKSNKNKIQNDTENTDKDIDKDIERKELSKESSKRKFEKPSLESVKKYCEERKNGINAEIFVNFYDSKGWLIGKTPMRDWKAAVRTWEEKRKNETKNSPDFSGGLMSFKLGN